MYDFNDAGPQQSFDLIPAGAKIPVMFKLRPGNVGDDGALTASNSSDALYLDVELIVTRGQFEGSRFWQTFVVEGGKINAQGRSVAGDISRNTLRAIIESARNIRPDDESERARGARRINSYFDFNQMEFAIEVGIEKGGDKPGGGKYSDKNRIKVVITPDKPDYQEVMSGQAVGAQPPAQQQVAAWQKPQGPHQTAMNHSQPASPPIPPAGESGTTSPAWKAGNSAPPAAPPQGKGGVAKPSWA